MTMKWIGALLVIAGCGGVGFTMAASYRREERCLRALLRALDYMTCELQFRLTPLPELCRTAGKECGGPTGEALKMLSQELESQINPDADSCMYAALCKQEHLPTSTAEALTLLGKSLGRFDLEGQLQGIESVRSHCRRELTVLEAGRDQRIRGYQTLGVCAGAALAILFV